MHTRSTQTTIMQTACKVERRLTRLLKHPLWAPLNDLASWERLSTRLNPMWSLSSIRASVVRLVDEGSQMRSIWLKPSWRFTGFQAGQHVLLELDCDGVRRSRCFTLSRAPSPDGLLRLTIKRKPEGPVSQQAHRLEVGQNVRISQAQGSFVLPSQGRLLLLGGGSGITPLLAMLDALRTSPARDVVLVFSQRERAQAVFTEALDSMLKQLPKLRLIQHFSAEVGRLEARSLATLVPDWRARSTLMCGPDAMMQSFEQLYAEAGLMQQLHSERFGRRAAAADAGASSHAIAAEKSKQVFTAFSGQSLLDAAELAGMKPKFGCRSGICRSCTCRKLSGTVRDNRTGRQSGPGDELIQLCISTACSAVTLAL